jgi:acyl dehydratase
MLTGQPSVKKEEELRYLEDFKVGDVYELGKVLLTQDDILQFGRKYDPQPFHVDLARAAESSFEGLVASGWQVACAFMRCYVDDVLNDSASEGSPGVDEMRFHRPVRAGEVLSARMTVLGTVPSLGRRDTGIMRPRCELVDPAGTVVFSMILHSIFRRRGQEN